MDENGWKALLAFYNQTFHGMTMAAALRSLGKAFKLNDRLAANMLGNVERVIVALQSNPSHQQFAGAWVQAQNWLEGPCCGAVCSDHSSDLYELNALAYITWTKLCDNPSARHYAEENYTVVTHPDQHPGLKGIKRIWANLSTSGTPSTQATLPNLAALVEGEGNGPS